MPTLKLGVNYLNDARLRSASNNYTTATNGGPAVDQVNNNGSTIYVGQNKETATPQHRLHESFHSVNVDELPLNAQVTAVRFVQFVDYVHNTSAPPWTCDLYAYAWENIDNHVTADDWRTPEQLAAMTLIGTGTCTKTGKFVVTGNQAFIDLVEAANATGDVALAWVYFMAASNRLRNRVASTGAQYLQVFSSNHNTAAERPYVEIDYDDPAEDPVISSLNPNSGAAWAALEVNGTNFPADASIVFIDGDDWEADDTWYPDIYTWSPTRITIAVPAMPAGTYNVQVLASQGDSNLVPFTVTAPPSGPSITSVVPDTAAIGDVVTLFGTDLTPYNSIEFDAVGGVEVLTESPVAISVVVPAGLSPGAVTITLDGVFGDDTISFTVAALPVDETPVIVELSPIEGQVGDAFTLAGVYLAADAVVKFGTEEAVTQHDVSFPTTRMSGVVPALTPGTYAVTVETSVGVSADVNFEVVDSVAPAISSIDPTSGPDGTYVVIRGTLFGLSGLVHVGGVTAKVSDWSYTEVVAEVPVGLVAGVHALVLTAVGPPNLASNPIPFEVITQARSESHGIVAAGASEFVALVGEAVHRVPARSENHLAAMGTLRSSDSSLRVVGIKELHHLVAFHDPLEEFQSFGITVYVDGDPLEEQFILGPTDALSTTLLIVGSDGEVGVRARRVAYRARIIGDEVTGPELHGLEFYATLPPVQRYQYVLKAIEESGDANDLPMQSEPGPKLALLRALRRSGRVVTVSTRADGTFDAKLEKVQRLAIKVDEHSPSQEQGIVIVQVREM